MMMEMKRFDDSFMCLPDGPKRNGNTGDHHHQGDKISSRCEYIVDYRYWYQSKVTDVYQVCLDCEIIKMLEAAQVSNKHLNILMFKTNSLRVRATARRPMN